MKDQTLAKLEAWARYFQDLGLDVLYRPRCAAPRPEARASERAAAPAAASSKAAAKPPSSGVGASAPTRSGPPIGASAPEHRPNKVLQQVQTIPVAGAPSLFETVERVEGDTLERIRADIGECTRCRLHKSRSRIVFGDGAARPDLVFVGEGPGEEEDRQGLPFVGRAGKLLTQMIVAMGLERKDVYICNVVKCRPPQNRTPERDEMATCQPFLERQLAVLRPKVIVCLGNVAVQALLGPGKPMSELRGKWVEWRGTKLLPTYHPAYLLRNPNAKGVVWADLQKVIAELGLPPPPKRSER